jgi:hypothetical protein
MKYLKKFENAQSDQYLEPTSFDIMALERVKSIFTDLAEDNNWYRFDWSGSDFPKESGVHYTYFTWAELAEQGVKNTYGSDLESKERFIQRWIGEMLKDKSFEIRVYVNTKIDSLGRSQVAVGFTNYIALYEQQRQMLKQVNQKITQEITSPLESLGYVVKTNWSPIKTLGVATDLITLKINYKDI